MPWRELASLIDETRLLPLAVVVVGLSLVKRNALIANPVIEPWPFPP